VAKIQQYSKIDKNQAKAAAILNKNISFRPLTNSIQKHRNVYILAIHFNLGNEDDWIVTFEKNGGKKMKDTLLRLKDKIVGSPDGSYDYPDEFGEDYLEIDENAKAATKAKVVVKTFTLKEFSDMRGPLDALREGYTIALINVGELRRKDTSELKRAIEKLKKTCQAIEGDVAGFGNDWIVATPAFAEVQRQ